MNPQDPGAPQQQPDYNFILNPNQPAPKSPLGNLGGGSSTKQRIIVVAAGAIILLIIIGIFGALLTSGGKGGTRTLVDLAAEQQEIIRITEAGYTTSTDPAVRAMAVTTSLSVTSQQKSLTEALKAGGTKVDNKVLNSKRSAKNDSALEDAKLAGRFDESFKELIATLLTQYIKDANTAYKQTKSPATKSAIADAVNSSTLIVSANIPQ